MTNRFMLSLTESPGETKCAVQMYSFWNEQGTCTCAISAKVLPLLYNSSSILR